MKFLRRGACLGLMAAILLVAGLAGAQAPDLYSGAAAVNSQDSAERSRALAPALVAALVKASGDSTLTGDSRLPALLEQAPGLAQTFGYRQEVEPGADGAPRVRDYLVVQFEPAGVQNLLTELGRSLWGERPLSVVWLVVDDGSARRVATAAQAAALGALTSRVRARGIKVVLPGMDKEDLARVDADALWSGPSGAALGASARYGASVALIARLARTGAGWSGRFTLADGSRSVEWSGSFVDSNAALVAAADGLADRLAHRYSVAAIDRVVAEYQVTVSGVDSAEDYARVFAHLAGLTVITAVEPVGADGNVLSLRLTLNVTPARLRQVLALGGPLTFKESALADETRIALRVVR